MPRCAKVPCRMRLHILIDLNGANATLGQYCPHFIGIERTLDRRLERALELLLVLILAHLAPQIGQFAGCNDAALGRLEHHVKPRWVLLGVVVNLPELVLAFGCTNECRPALAISKHRADDLVPDLRFHIRELIEDNPIQVRTPKRIGIVSAVETNH